MRLDRVPFVITLQKSQANMLQNVTEKGYERSIKEDIITKNAPGKQICVPFCLPASEPCPALAMKSRVSSLLT